MLAVKNLSPGFHSSPTHSPLSSYLGHDNGACRPQRCSTRRRTSSSSLLGSYEGVGKQASSLSSCSGYEQDPDVVTMRLAIHAALKDNISTVDVSLPPFEPKPLLATATTRKSFRPNKKRPGDRVITYKIPVPPDFSFLPSTKDDREIAIGSPIEDWFVLKARSCHDGRSHPWTSAPANPRSNSQATPGNSGRPIFPDYDSDGSSPARRRCNARLKTPKNPWFKLGIPYRAPAMPDYDWVQEGTFDRSQKKMTADEYLGLCKAYKIVNDDSLPVYQTEGEETGDNACTLRYTESAEVLSPLRALAQLPWKDRSQHRGFPVGPWPVVMDKTGDDEIVAGEDVPVEVEDEEHWHDVRECVQDQLEVERVGEQERVDVQKGLKEDDVEEQKLPGDGWVDVQKVLHGDQVLQRHNELVDDPLVDDELVDDALDFGWKATAWSITKGWLKMMAKPW